MVSLHLLGCQPEASLGHHFGGAPETEGDRAVEAAKALGVSLNRLNELVLGKRGVTADTALRLARFLRPLV